MIYVKLNIQKFASGTITFPESKISGNVTLQGKLEWSSTASGSQDNYSSVTADLYVRKQHASQPTYGKNWRGSITIGDYTDSFTSLPSVTYVTNDWVKIWTFTKQIPHNQDGTKSITISGSVTGATGTSAANTTSSGNEYVTLDTIPRYANITSFNVNKRDETSVQITWTADANCDYVQYQINDGGWIDLPNSGIVSGLNANVNYKFLIRVRRTDSQLWTESWEVWQSTYSYPSVYNLPNFTIGQPVTLGVNNPLNREFKIYFNFNDTDYLERTITNSFSGWNESEAIDKFYELLSNAEQGSYTVKIVYGEHIDIAGQMSIFKIDKEVSKPIFNDFYFEDVNSKTLALTNDSSKIVDGYSTIRVTIPSSIKAQGYKNAQINYYNINGSNRNYAENFTTEPNDITNYSLGYINVSAIDTRSNEKLVQKSTTLLGYFKPTANISAEYTNATRNNQGVGSQVTFKFKGTFWNNNFGNVVNTIKSASYKFKKTGDSVYGGDISIDTNLITINGNDYSFSGILNGDASDNGFEIDESYDVTITISDELDSVQFNYVVTTGSPAIDLFGNCVALGGMYDEQVGGRVQIKGLTSLDVGWISNVDLNDIKSTGMYYATTDLTNCPVNGYMYLLVFRVSTSGDFVQIGVAIAQNEMYVRTYVNNSYWNNWKKITTS